MTTSTLAVHPRPWFGIPHGKQWPFWVGVAVLGVFACAADATLGGGILLIESYAGQFVMGRRLARRKLRSPDLAILWLILGGWITVLVYAVIAPAQPRQEVLYERRYDSGPSF